jgi:hypothetical protein
MLKCCKNTYTWRGQVCEVLIQAMIIVDIMSIILCDIYHESEGGRQPMNNDHRINLLTSFLKNGSIFQDVLIDQG